MIPKKIKACISSIKSHTIDDKRTKYDVRILIKNLLNQENMNNQRQFKNFNSLFQCNKIGKVGESSPCDRIAFQ
jgi:hypothetical protein